MTDSNLGNVQFLAGKEVVVTLAVSQGIANEDVIGYESAAVTISASKGALTTKSDLDNAIVKAINTDAVLSELAVASIDSNGILTVEYLVDGVQLLNGVTVDVSNPATGFTGVASAAMVQEFQEFTKDSTYTQIEIDALYTNIAGTGAVAGVDQASIAATLSGYTIAPTWAAVTDTYAITIGSDTINYTATGTTDNITTGTAIAAALVAEGYSAEADGAGVVSVVTDETVTVVAVGGSVTTTASAALNILGTASATTGTNTVNGDLGDDVIVLSSHAATIDTVVFDAGQFGNDTIVHFTEGAANSDILDFKAYLNNMVDISANGNNYSALRIDTTLEIGVGAEANFVENSVVVTDFTTLDTAATAVLDFDTMTNAQVLEGLNATVTYAADAQSVNMLGTVQNSIMMVENVDNAGEFKVYEVTSNSTLDNTTDAFTAATLVGSVDFGESTVALDAANFA